MSRPNDAPHCPCCGKPTTLYAFRGQPWPKEDEAYRLRIKNLVAQFQLEGYNTYETDMSVAVAVAQMMAARGPQQHLERLLSFHAERIAAGSLV